MQKTLFVQCLYSVKSCSRPCSRQLAKNDANYSKQQLEHNIDICNAKHGAKQHVYFVNDSKQFYERSSAKLSHSLPPPPPPPLRLREHFSERYDLTCAQFASEKSVLKTGKHEGEGNLDELR